MDVQGNTEVLHFDEVPMGPGLPQWAGMSGNGHGSDPALIGPRTEARDEVEEFVDPDGDGIADNTAAIAYAIMGKASEELSTQALLNLERIIMAVIMEQVTLEGKNITPVVQFADNLEEGEVLEDQSGNVLPANVNGAYVSGGPGKAGTILISNDLRDDPAKLAEVMLEEVGEAIGDHADNQGFEPAVGDVGDRIKQVVRGVPEANVTFEVTDGGLDENAEPNPDYDEQYVMLGGVRTAAKTATEDEVDMAELAAEWGVTEAEATNAVTIAEENFVRRDAEFIWADDTNFDDEAEWGRFIAIYGNGNKIGVYGMARAIIDGAMKIADNSEHDDGFAGIDLLQVSNHTLTDKIWAHAEEAAGTDREQIPLALLSDAVAYVTGDAAGFADNGTNWETIQDNFADVTLAGETRQSGAEGPTRFSQEAIQSIWDSGAFAVTGIADDGAITFEVDAAAAEAGTADDEISPIDDEIGPIDEMAQLYGVTPQHYANTYASAEAFLAEQPGGTIGLDTDYANLDFHALLGVYGDKFQQLDVNAEGLTRAILDGAMSLPAVEAYTTSPINVEVDSTSFNSIALAVMEHARDGAASDDAVVPTSITAEELDVGLASVLLNSFDNYGPEHYNLIIKGFGDVQQPDGTFELSFEAVKSILYNSVINKDGSAEGKGYIPYQLDEVRLKAHDPDKDISLEVHVNPEDIPAEDAPYPVSEELETILSAGSGLTMAEVELLDETAAANVGDRIDAITDADAPELVHYKQLLQLKTAAGDPAFAIHMDVDAVNADIQELMLTEPVATMLNETHEAAIVETFGVTGLEQAATFLDFATNRDTIQSIFALPATDREYVINHIVAIMARFDPDVAAEYSEMVFPLILGEQVNYAVENNGRLMASSDETVVNDDGEIELTEEVKAHRDEQVSRWLSFAISQPRNVGGANLEWVSSLRSASAHDFELITNRVSEFTQLPFTDETTFGDWMEDFFSDANNGLEEVSNYSGVHVQIREAEASGDLAQMWGVFAAFSVAMDASVIADKKANGEDLTAADYMQTAGDLMQMISGDYNGRQIFTSSAVQVVENFEKANTSPFEIAVHEMARAEKSGAGAADIDTFVTKFNAAAMGNDTAKGEFVFNNPELVKALGIAGETAAEQKAVGAQYFNRAIVSLDARGLKTTEQVKEHFVEEFNAEMQADDILYGETVGTGADNQAFLSEFEIIKEEDSVLELEGRAMAAAESVVGAQSNDGIIAGQRSVNVAAQIWEDGAAEGVGAEGISAGALEYVGYAGRKMGMFGAAANFAYAGVEVTKALDEYDEGHSALAGLHGAMAADFALIGTTSLLGTWASVSGMTAGAAMLSATAGWGVFALIGFQLITAVTEELQREEDLEEVEADLAKASLGELGREEQYYYVPRTTAPAQEPDDPNPWV